MYRTPILTLFLLTAALSGCPKAPDSRVPSPPGKVPDAAAIPKAAPAAPWPLAELTLPAGATALGGEEQAGRPYGGGGTFWEKRFSDPGGWGEVAAHVEAGLAKAGYSRLDGEMTTVDPLPKDSAGQELSVQKGLRTYLSKDKKRMVKLEYRYKAAGDDGNPEHLYRYELVEFSEPQPAGAGVKVVPLK